MRKPRSKLATAGVHTLVEKPIAHTLDAGQRMVDAFADSRTDRRCRATSSGSTRRCRSCVVGSRRVSSERVYQVTTRRQGPFPSRIADVGVAKDLASHDVDLTAWVVQSDYERVFAQTAFKSGREHEDMITITGRTASGVIVNNIVNWLSPMKERVTVVTGEKGAFVADTSTGDLTFYANGTIPLEWESVSSFRGVSEGDVTRYAFAKREPLRVEHEAFRDAVLGKDTDIVTIEQGQRTLTVVESALQSARTGESMSLSGVKR